jgi:cell division protein FtsL
MNGFAGFLGRSLRGVRLVEFGALLVLLVMATGVYLAKAAAGRERADITQVQGQIDDENKRLRLLQAEVAHLEEPERLGRLSAQLGLGPTAPKRQGSPDELGQIARDALLPEKAEKTSAAVVAQAAVTGAPQ